MHTRCLYHTGCMTSGLLLLLLSINIGSAYNNGYTYELPHSAKLKTASPFKYLPPTLQQKDLREVWAVKNVEFGFPSEQDRIRAIQTGQYNPDSAIPIDVDVYYPPNNAPPTVFVTIPRFGEGVPYSLAYLTDVPRPNGTQVQAYPNYNWHRSHGGDCDGLTSVYRVQVDTCGRMWILDSGEIGFVQYCAPQLVVIDLTSARVVHRYKLPQSMYKNSISRFVTPHVDIADPGPYGRCQQAVVYMADPTGNGIVVYDTVKGRSWRIENKYTFPDPDFATLTIAGESFELLDGAFGLSITPRGLGLRRMLFLYSLSNDLLSALPLDVANNETKWQPIGDISTSIKEFIPLGKRGVQCGMAAMTSQGFWLCVHLEPIALFGWNIRTHYKPQNRQLLAENREQLQFVSGMKVIRNPNTGNEDVWMLSNRLQKLFAGTVNYNEINFRVLKCGVSELLLGQQCKM